MTTWLPRPIGSVVKIMGGGTPTRTNPDYYGGNIPWVTPKDMKQWDIRGTQITLTELGINNSAAKIIPVNSVLIVVRSGVLKHTVPVGINRVPVAINQDMKALICSDAILPSYLARFIKERSGEILGWVRATTADNFPIEKIKDLKIPLPPINEQQRIVEALDRTEAARANRRQTIALLDDLAQSIFLEMFGDQQSILERWPNKNLGDILDFLTSGSRGWAKHYTDSAGDKFLRIQNIRTNELVLDDVAFVNPPNSSEAKRTLVQTGDVILSITADLGRTAVIPSDLGRAFINQHLSILRTSRINPHYLSAYLSSTSGQLQIHRRNRQGVKAGLNFDDIRSLRIPVPPAALQHEFVSRIQATRTLLQYQRTHLTEVDALFSSLQQKAFRGEL